MSVESKFDPKDPATFNHVHDIGSLAIGNEEFAQVWRKYKVFEQFLSKWMSRSGLTIVADIVTRTGFNNTLHVSVSRLIGQPNQEDISGVISTFFRSDSPIAIHGQVSSFPRRVIHLRQAPIGTDPETYLAGMIASDQRELYDITNN